MRVPYLYLAVVVILSCVSFVVAQNIRGNPIAIQDDAKSEAVDESGGVLVNQVSETVNGITSRLLGRKRNRGSRNKKGRKWEDLERPRVDREGSDDVDSDLMEDWRKRGKKWRDQYNTATLKPEATEFYESSSGAFDVKIPLFSSESALGYSGDDDQLRKDLVEATKFKVNRILEYNVKNNFYYRVDAPMMAMTMEDSQPMAMTAEASVSSPVAGDVSSYGTNNVEASIDEGDALKTNGKVACASYGDTVVCWNAKKGSYITNITLPPLENADPYQYPGPFPQPRPLPILVVDEPVALEEEVQAMEERATASSAGQPVMAAPLMNRNGNRNRRKLLSMAYVPMKPQVESLLLHEDKLVVISSGYGPSLRKKLDYKPTLNEAFNTNIRIYDLSSLKEDEEPPLLKETNIHGRFDSVRAVDNQAHLVTFSNVNMYNFFDEHLSRFQPKFQGMDEEEYMEAAKQMAEEELIPKFVRQLMEDLKVNDERINLAKVCMWQRHLSGTNSKLEDTVFEGGVMTSFAQVTSFDMKSNDDDKSLSLSASGVLMPTSWGHVYATDKMLVLAGQGWDWVEEWRGSVQTTYLLGFALLKSGKTIPAAVGSLQGTIIGDYSVDVVDENMRIAVFINNNMWRFQDPPAAADMPPPTENYIRVLEIPEMDDKGNCKKGNCVLQQVGTSKSFGKEGETFRGVRFSDKVAYVVTFRQTDPFYVVTFEDPVAPVMAGELEKTGFSSYLHFINEDNTLLLGVGQEADNDGRTLGVQIVLYDATDPNKPKDIQTYDYLTDPDVRAYSQVLFDSKAFRYVPLKDDEGILIMPMRLDVTGSSDGNFDGFIVFDISKKRIAERMKISHVDSADFRNRCYGSNELKSRSFVIDGDVTTLKKHSIRQYNLDEKEPVGMGIDLDDDIEADPYMGCIYW